MMVCKVFLTSFNSLGIRPRIVVRCSNELRLRLSDEHASDKSSPSIPRCSVIRAALNLLRSPFRSALIDSVVKNLPLMSPMLLKHFIRCSHVLELQTRFFFCSLRLVSIIIDPGDDEVDDLLSRDLFIMTVKVQ